MWLMATSHARNGRHKSTEHLRGHTITAAIPVGVVAVIAGIVSYTHIVALGSRAHQGWYDAHLLPFAVDGLIVAGVVIVLCGFGLGWLSIGLGVAATVFANVESGVPYGPLAATVAAWPAVAFSVASFVLERWLKSRLKAAAPEPEAVEAPVPVQVEPAAIPEPVTLPPLQFVSPEPEAKPKPPKKPAASTRKKKPASTPETRVPEDVDTQAAALEILAREPGISGSELGRRLGRTERYGCILKKQLTTRQTDSSELKETP